MCSDACGRRSRCCTSPAPKAVPGNARTTAAATRTLFIGERPTSREADAFLARKGKPLLLGRIFTTVIRPFIRVLLASVVAALAVPALAFAAQPKVLAIHFDTEVNPV